MPTPFTQSPLNPSAEPADTLLARSFAKFDGMALGVACGVVLGLTILTATLILILKGGSEVGPTLALLGQFFPGYTVTPVGSLVGLAYGFVSGFVLGWFFAVLHNVTMTAYLFLLELKANLSNVTDYIDPDHSTP